MKRDQVVLAVSIIVGSVLGGGGAADVDAYAGVQGGLRALVPLKTGFTEFVSWSGSPLNATFNGFCVEVFRYASLRLPSGPLNFSLLPFGDGLSSPSYDDMIQMLLQGKADAIVADITISKDRLKKVDFTQPFMPSSLRMVTPFRYGRVGGMWDFLRPFSMELWVVILFAFFGTGLVMFTLEHKNPDFHQTQSSPTSNQNIIEDDQPLHSPFPLKYTFRRLVSKLGSFYWFTSLTVFFSQKESVMTHAGRFVMVVWLLVVLIFTSSYTASLASTLSRQQPVPTIQGFEFLLKSSVPIAYPGGSFLQNYLTMLGIRESRLKAVETEEQYANALRLGPKAGGVGAIIDEQPYVESFLNTECEFTAVGDPIAFFGGFAFAFAKNSTVTGEMSMAILSLAQDGTLQRLKEKWVGPSQCTINPKASSHMRLSSFGGLFIILVAVYGMCVVWKVIALQVKRKYMQAAHNIGSMARVSSIQSMTHENV